MMVVAVKLVKNSKNEKIRKKAGGRGTDIPTTLDAVYMQYMQCSSSVV